MKRVSIFLGAVTVILLLAGCGNQATNKDHSKFELLEDTLKEHSVMDRMQVRDALSLVSKGNFGEFESMEWSVIFDQSALTAIYYHRENYDKSYAFELFSK